MINSIRRYLAEFLMTKTIDENFRQSHRELGGLAGAGTAEVISKCVYQMTDDYAYLEVGIYQACNFVIVANSNKSVDCYGVDNFSQEFEENKLFTESTEEVVKSRIEKYCPEAKYFKSDFREFLSKPMPFDKQVGVYFFDGPHELQDQIDGVEMAIPHLADEAIIFVDDLNSPNVQESYSILLDRHPKELIPIGFLIDEYNSKETFSQGQVIFEYRRQK